MLTHYIVLTMLRCSNETLANKFLYKLELFDMYAFKIAYWALIFIFRLRFPPGVSIALVCIIIYRPSSTICRSNIQSASSIA